MVLTSPTSLTVVSMVDILIWAAHNRCTVRDWYGLKPFADISKFSYFKDEDEILMMLGSVFRLNKIYLHHDQIWRIQMTLCSDNVGDLKKTFNHMEVQYGVMDTRLLLFANVLIDMSHFDAAGEYLRRLLKQLPYEHRDIPKCYHALGKVSCEKGDYKLSLDYFTEARKILEKSNDSQLGYIYNGIGEVYQNQGDLKQAMESYEKALNIFKQTSSKTDENIAWCYNNIGIIYEKNKDYSKALDYLENSLTIKKNILPAGHPCLGNTYNNLGNVYYYLQEYDQALNKYELSYEIFHKSLKPRHPSIARVLRNIGIAYEVKKDFKEAKKYYEKASNIREFISSSSHPDVIEIKKDIVRVSSKNI
jgi:tetratricopeptide (TPR) repeat protein